MMDVCRQCNCSGVSGSGGGPVVLRPLILVVGESIVLMPVCFAGQIQTWIGVVCVPHLWRWEFGWRVDEVQCMMVFGV